MQRILSRFDDAGVSASVGVASREPDLSLEDAWQKADGTMYAEKRKRKESGVLLSPAKRKCAAGAIASV